MKKKPKPVSCPITYFDWYSDSIPTPEEWEELTADEPEIYYYREQIRNHGKIDVEEI